MSFCIKCTEPADVCFCETQKVLLGEYADVLKKKGDIKCYCKDHIPKE